MFNIPNLLTVVRFLLLPIFAYFLYNGQYLIGGLIFIFAGITDVLDGYIARKYNMVTSLGKLADPFADKCIQLTALTVLVIQGIIPKFVLVLIILKEFFMLLGSILLYKKLHHVSFANWYGKSATIVFYFAVIGIIFIKIENLTSSYANILTTIFVLLAVVSSLFAFIVYALEFKKMLSKKRLPNE